MTAERTLRPWFEVLSPPALTPDLIFNIVRILRLVVTAWSHQAITAGDGLFRKLWRRPHLALGAFARHAAAMVSASSQSSSGSVRHEVTLRGITWEQYVALRAADARPGLSMTYLDGVLEIMSPSDRHELDKTLIARLLEVVRAFRRSLQGG